MNKIRTKLSRCNVKLVFGEPEYFVNLGKKAVACKLNFDVKTPVGEYSNGHLFNYLDISGNDWFCPKTSVVGVAHCSEKDDWNTETGCKIAKARAEEKAYRKVLASVKKSVKELEELVAVGKDFIAAAENNCKHNEEYIARLAE